MPLEKDIETINDSLKKVNDQLKANAEEAQKQIRLRSEMDAETKQSVDKLLVQQGELQARLAASEQALAKLQTGGGDPARPKSLGERVAEADQIRNFNTQMQGQVSVKVGKVHAVITGSGNGAVLLEPQRVPGIVVSPNQRLFVRDLLNFSNTTASSIDFIRESGFTNNAAPVSENPADGKPESTITFEDDSARIATIAHWIRASKQILADAPQLQAHIDGRLIYGLKLKEELQLLKGSGVGLNINGIYTQAENYADPGVHVQNETMIDRLRIALLQVTLAEYEADGIVLNPIDWCEIELTKTSDNAYLFATPRGLAVPGLWARPVVASKALDEDEFLCGAFRLGAQGWDREDAAITVSNSDGDNFIKNRVTILCEERVGLTVYRPESFVKGSFEGLMSSD